MDYMGAVIWQKQTTMNTTGGGAVMGSFPYPRNGILKIDYEFILIFKKQGRAPVPTTEQKIISEMTKEEWNSYFSSHWHFPGAKQDGHIAVFPEELPHRLIRMFSFAGETVFDPFMGSGTTALAAKNLQRNSIGYELNPEFKQYYEQKVLSSLSFDETTFIFERDTSALDIDNRIAALPYTFSDPHKMNNKVDIKNLQFGSKIDKTTNPREDYFSVQAVLSPNTMLLNNGVKIRLIGIKEKPTVNGNATKFLKEKTTGKKVFLRFDSVKYDDQNSLLCYLYLDNKTFLNAHMLKKGLADVDYSFDFKYKDKFKKLTSL